MAADPIEQFKISKMVDFGQVNLPLIGRTDLAITNSHIAMTIAFLAIVIFLTVVTTNMKIVPGRTQAVGEQLFSMIDDIGESIIGHEAKALFPFVFTVFSFILAMNLLGLFATFAVTSQLAITATFAVLTMGLVLIIGFARHGLGFFKLFVPSGVPWYAIWMVIPIEFVSFILRPFTLALRLFGNMLGGHVALKVFAGFIVALGALAAGGGLGWLGLPGAVLPFAMVVALTALEFLVAFLQAFVFAVLTCIYLNEVVNLGHGH